MNEAMQGITGEAKRGTKAVYTIVERPGQDKKFWIRIGWAFINRDHSLNVRLDASPTNGELHIRDYEPYDPTRRRGHEGLSGTGELS